MKTKPKEQPSKKPNYGKETIKDTSDHQRDHLSPTTLYSSFCTKSPYIFYIYKTLSLGSGRVLGSIPIPAPALY